jgi:E3 ubiquitin-protein ligase NEDD4
MVLCGRQEIDIEDWRKNTTYKGFTLKDPMIVWFWEIVTEFDQNLRSNLLHFCTGSTKVPIHGFKNL